MGGWRDSKRQKGFSALGLQPLVGWGVIHIKKNAVLRNFDELCNGTVFANGDIGGFLGTERQQLRNYCLANENRVAALASEGGDDDRRAS